MQLSRNGAGPRSAPQWGEIIARYRQSGLGHRDFCAAEGLVLRTFEKWERRLRRKETPKGQVVEIASSPHVSGPWAVEVEFPNGVRLRVRGSGEVGHARGTPDLGVHPTGRSAQIY